MDFVRNFPFICIMLAMVSGPVSSVLSGKKAGRLCMLVVSVCGILSGVTLYYTLRIEEPFVYTMGRFPAPFGNEIRAGVLEALMATFFCLIMLLSLIGGLKYLKQDVPDDKKNLYFIMIDLLLASLLSLIYTNDMFTGYVFVEINTIAACGLIMIRGWGRNILAATKYMIMSLLGSGLVLVSISILYGITGHLLMSNMHVSVVSLVESKNHIEPLIIAVGLFAVGIAIKSALFPFHAWLPDAYSYSTCASSAILSSLVSKGYILFLLKFMYRVIGTDVLKMTGADDVLFMFGIAAMLVGSIDAIQQTDISRMIAFSSIAQIGYIYMGFGLGVEAGMVASVFHILAHASAKSMLFVSANGLSEVSGGSMNYRDLRGSGIRNRTAGVGFVVGSLSMVGIPIFAGFTSKVYFAQAALGASTAKEIVTLIALAISTVLNAMYFIRMTISVYTPDMNEQYRDSGFRTGFSYRFSMFVFVVIVLVFGILSNPIFDWISRGLSQFS
ncbi:MAG: sodium:proton antiporter [Lachnospiraceae bacterium]|nr:sodium:proton antiporter [Lachnospiraceae bacterium]